MGLSLLEGASPPAVGWVLLAEGIQYETVRLCQVSHKHRSSLSESKSPGISSQTSYSVLSLLSGIKLKDSQVFKKGIS